MNLAMARDGKAGAGRRRRRQHAPAGRAAVQRGRRVLVMGGRVAVGRRRGVLDVGGRVGGDEAEDVASLVLVTRVQNVT